MLEGREAIHIIKSAARSGIRKIEEQLEKGKDIGEKEK
jgi:hypothetical protein